MLNRFIELSERTIESVDTRYIRDQISLLRQPERLIGIKGSRGVGKTTLLLQYAKSNLKIGTRLYVSLDNPFFAKNNLLEFVDEYIKNGGKHLLLDEVHHYKDWSASLKHIYDNYKDLQVIYTGSSLLHLTKGRADLSRRSILNTLSGLIGLSINTLKDYLYYLNEAMLISLLRSDKKGISRLAKPEKIYLHHPNLMFCLATENANQGSIRESFFFNRVKALFEVGYTDKGDFSVGEKHIFEIGGKNKKYRQIANIDNSYIAADDLETGFKNTIPLWLFGFLY